jgi:hypothetical protein
LCFVFSAIALGAWWFARDIDHQLDGAPTTTATVVDVTNPAKGSPYLELDLTLPDGRVVRANTDEYLDAPTKGAQLQVQYAADGKGLLVREVGAGSDRPGLGSLIAAGASALIGLVLLILRTRGDQQSDAVKNPVQPER